MGMLYSIRKILSARLNAVSTVEGLLAMSLFMLYGTFLIGALAFSTQSTKYPSVRDSAIRYAEEGIEVARYLRKGAITNLPNGIYGLQEQANEWALVSSPETISANFSRSISISSPTTNTRAITSSVNWTDGGRTGTESVSTIISNWVGPASSPWSLPTLLTTFDAFRNEDMSRLHVEGSTLFALRRNSTTNGYAVSFNISALPTITQTQSFAVSADTTDALFTPTRLYASSTANSRELFAVNISNPAAMSLYGTLDLARTTNAQGIALINSRIYVTQGSAFRRITDNGTGTFANSHTYTGTGTLYDIANFNNTYAYVSTSSTTQEIYVMDISNLSATPTRPATINLPTSTTGKIRLGTLGNYLLVFSYQGGIYIYNTTTSATAPTFVANFPIGGAYLINDFVIDSARNLVFIATTNPSAEIQILDFTNPSTVVTRGTYNMSVTPLSLALDTANDRLFIGSADNTTELTVLDAK